MKLLCIIMLAMIGSTLVFAAQGTIKLKTGKSYTGEIISMNEEKIVIKTAIAELGFPWDRLDKDSIKKYNPGLYQQMLEEERLEKEKLIKEKDYVKYKGKWMLPEKKKEFEMLEKGLALYDGKWLPTNEVAQLTLDAEMKAKGMAEYKGKYYTENELKDVKSMDQNKGLKIGMSTEEVVAKWGAPTRKKESDEFKSRKREMWFYINEDEGIEDRLVFEMDALRVIQTNQPISD